LACIALMQKAWRDDPKHVDVEGAQYHYPSRYFGFMNGFETILNENGVAFVGMRDGDTVVALNTRAEALPLFA